MGDVDGLVTFCELAVPLMTRLAEVCGLPGNTSEAVDNARNKVGTQERYCRQAGRQAGHACKP